MDETRSDEALDARLREHYTALPGETRTVAALRATEDSRPSAGPAPSSARSTTLVPRPVRQPAHRHPHRLPRATPTVRWAVAASLLVLSAVSVHVAGTHGERIASTVREAAMNHGTRLAPEFPESDLTTLTAAMTQLPFELRRPDRIDADWQLLGGRYCSLAGNLAAHVRLLAPDGEETLSLFVTRETDALERLDGKRHEVDGVDVELWSESGLFYAMARSAS